MADFILLRWYFMSWKNYFSFNRRVNRREYFRVFFLLSHEGSIVKAKASCRRPPKSKQIKSANNYMIKHIYRLVETERASHDV